MWQLGRASIRTILTALTLNVMKSVFNQIRASNMDGFLLHTEIHFGYFEFNVQTREFFLKASIAIN